MRRDMIIRVSCPQFPVLIAQMVARGFQRTRDLGNNGGDGMVTIDKNESRQPRDDRISSIQIRHGKETQREKAER